MTHSYNGKSFPYDVVSADYYLPRCISASVYWEIFSENSANGQVEEMLVATSDDDCIRFVGSKIVHSVVEVTQSQNLLIPAPLLMI